MPRVHRAYVDAGWGQVHLREAGQGPALVCLHATAYSGRSLEPLLPALSAERRVVLLDTPGYGNSDGPAEPVPFPRYAEAVAEAIAALEPGRAVDLFGYHTGALIATEIAAQHPELVRRLVLVGVPFFEGPDHAAWRAKLVHPAALTEAFEPFRARWDYFVTNRAAGVALERGFDNFVDELLAFPRDWWAHHALFDYDARPRLALLRCPALVINPDSPLAPASRAAAACIAGCEIVELPQAKAAIFDTALDLIVPPIRRFLGRADALAA